MRQHSRNNEAKNRRKSEYVKVVPGRPIEKHGRNTVLCLSMGWMRTKRRLRETIRCLRPLIISLLACYVEKILIPLDEKGVKTRHTCRATMVSFISFVFDLSKPLHIMHNSTGLYCAGSADHQSTTYAFSGCVILRSWPLVVVCSLSGCWIFETRDTRHERHDGT
uniref:Uncharacterized protein n=1 Tax=Odontella aurita TaxID=265563 RepID=A0A7S4MYN2_9STRA